ncbi:Ig-like domain-containing protein [Shewanella abyssi]|uniref:Ig-like domain-containing protein n=1 Tax=Shewanella abyssi TaxID=311789 RepID=UPI00200C5EA3|nr:Ig-like domain-containing protein [Shewanella abyssi]MCL1048356.1 Ig-like domain-containing protein [Shewanella abyssi]
MKSAYSVFIALIWSFFLVGCGGGGSISAEPGDGGTPSPVTISIQLSTTNTQISVAENAEITAKVIDSNGAAVSTLVSFTLNNDTYGTFEPGTGEVSTGADGIATIKLNTASIPTGAAVTATISSGEKATINVTMVGDGGESTGGPTVSLVLTDEKGVPINAISTLSPGKLTATVTGMSKATIVTFATSRGEIPIDTAVTEEDKAYVQILAGSEPGAAIATATLLTGETVELVFNVGATNVFMGSGDPFQSGVASISPAIVSAGGTASISVILQDDQGNPFIEPAEVQFSSTCFVKSTPEADLSTPVVAVNGMATSTYLSKGCVGDDTINISANVGGKALTATATLNVLPASVGSIYFIEAAPENIRLKGTGGTESSIVKFKVLDKNGNPVKNQLVNFSLNTETGDIELEPSNAVTDSEGIAQTVVNSGTVSTSVRVTAIVDASSPEISSQSNLLVVSTGLPDQDSFSLSADNLNPEGWGYDGVEVNVVARLADTFNNPVPDGTAVSFTTEGGVIDPSCLTVSGTCSVKWTSQNPRPTGKTLDGEPSTTPDLGPDFGGRVTILATAIGEESFPDLNGNGRFDASELATFEGEDVSGNKYDLSEAFVDHNEDTLYNPAKGDNQDESGDLETFIDFNNNAIFDVADGVYNGSLCALDVNGNTHSGCSTINKSLNVRASVVLIMSGSDAFSSTPTIIDSCEDDRAKEDPCDGLNDNNVLDILGKSTGAISIIIGDLHNQSLPSGTEIIFSPSAGSLASKGTFTVSSTNNNGSNLYSVVLKGADEPDAGSLVIEAITPKGNLTQIATIPVVIH